MKLHLLRPTIRSSRGIRIVLISRSYCIRASRLSGIKNSSNIPESSYVSLLSGIFSLLIHQYKTNLLYTLLIVDPATQSLRGLVATDVFTSSQLQLARRRAILSTISPAMQSPVDLVAHPIDASDPFPAATWANALASTDIHVVSSHEFDMSPALPLPYDPAAPPGTAEITDDTRIHVLPSPPLVSAAPPAAPPATDGSQPAADIAPTWPLPHPTGRISFRRTPSGYVGVYAAVADGSPLAALRGAGRAAHPRLGAAAYHAADSVYAPVAAAMAASPAEIPEWVHDIDAPCLPATVDRSHANELLRMAPALAVGLQNVNVFGPPSAFDTRVVFMTTKGGHGDLFVEEGSVVNYHLRYFRNDVHAGDDPMCVYDTRIDGDGEAQSTLQGIWRTTGLPRGIDEAFLRMRAGQVVRLMVDPEWGLTESRVDGVVTDRPLHCEIEMIEHS